MLSKILGLFNKEKLPDEKPKLNRKSTVISKSNTDWGFYLSSTEEEDVRHMFDVIFGVDILLKKGVAKENIHIWANHPMKKEVFETYKKDLIISEIEDFKSEASKLLKENFILVVGGHGDVEGISTSAGMSTPEFFLDSVSNSQSIKHCLIVLTQCFAGTFSYINAKRNVEFALIGATNLNLSISSGVHLAKAITQADGTEWLKEWSANLFSQNFFEWIMAPKDIDGDNKTSAMDAYKYSGAISNQQLKNVSLTSKIQLDKYYDRYKNLEEKVNRDIFEEEEFESLPRMITEKATILYNRQDPWILNSHFARNFQFKL